VIIDGKEIPEDEIDDKLKELDLHVFDGDGEFDLEQLKGLKKLKGLKRLEGLEGLKGLEGSDGHAFVFPSPSRGRLGVRVEKLNDEMRDALGSNGSDGVLVLEVMSDTPAQRAGLRAGDIITKVGGDPVDSPEALVKSLRGKDGKVRVQVLRKGLTKSIEAELRDDSSQDDARVRIAPRARTLRRNPEPGQGDRVYRWNTKGDAADGDLRDEIAELKKELRELREQLQEKK